MIFVLTLQLIFIGYYYSVISKLNNFAFHALQLTYSSVISLYEICLAISCSMDKNAIFINFRSTFLRPWHVYTLPYPCYDTVVIAIVDNITTVIIQFGNSIGVRFVYTLGNVPGRIIFRSKVGHLRGRPEQMARKLQ